MADLALWKHITQQANIAFKSEIYAHAEVLYLDAIELMKTAYSERNLSSTDDKPTMLHIICLSISIQNLADVYARQARWPRCFSTLERYLNLYEEAASDAQDDPNLALAFLQESCRLRRELFRHRACEKTQHDICACTCHQDEKMTERILH